MTLWLLVLGVGALVFAWSRNAKRARDEWLRALNLLGKWELESSADSASPSRSLTLTGALSAGKYVAHDGEGAATSAIERGEWRLSGHTLTLAATEGESAGDGPKRYDLRLFEAGRIGIDGPGRQREIYVKREGNVVPLVRGPKRRS